jgi:hypothetical protein
MAQVVTVAKGVKVDYTEFQRHITIYMMVMRMDVAQVVKQQARFFAKDMCDYTPPFSGSGPQTTKGGEGGFGTKARNKGQAAVSRDVRKIFAPLAQAPATAIAASDNMGILNAWMTEKLKLPAPHQPEYIFKMVEKSGKYHSAGIIGQGEFDYFQRVESTKGGSPVAVHLGTTEGTVKSIHVLRRGNPSYKVNKTNKSLINYVDNWRPVERYIKRVQQRVGKLKSGWYYAGLNLGKMPTSAWIANQGNSTSIYVPKLIGPDPTIKLGSSIGRRYSQGYHFMRMAMNHRYYSIRVAILNHLKGPRNHGKLQEVIHRLQSGFNLENTTES